jgi:hypothetical protein
MPSWRNKEWEIPSTFKGISPLIGHYSKLGSKKVIREQFSCDEVSLQRLERNRQCA